MKVSDILKSIQQKLATCAPEDSITAIAGKLSVLNIGALPVCGPDAALIGVISERDVVRGFAKYGARLIERHVRDLMTREVITCEPDTSMGEAEKLMHKHRVRHLPVVDGAKLMGMLSIRDVMATRLQESREEVNVLRDVVIAARHR